MNKEQLYMVFDVESIGLHGEGFAVGFVVVNGHGHEIQSASIACPRDRAFGDEGDRDWVEKNIPKFEPGVSRDNPKEVREVFWRQWMEWKKRGALLFADCQWPVEARFLMACVDDARDDRNWDGPYPLHEIASVLFAHGKEPTGKFGRLASEMPEHDPLCDARQSARVLIEALKTQHEKDNPIV